MGRMEGRVHESDVDAEGVIVGIRWLAVAFAIVQTATYYRPFPAGVEAVAWATNAAYALAAFVLTVIWVRTRRSGRRQSMRMGLASLLVDAAFALSLVFIYAFDVETAIFATLYIVALEGAFRFGMRGALLTTAGLTRSTTSAKLGSALASVGVVGTGAA